MAFSGALTLTDLNDFITPSQACIKPVEAPEPEVKNDVGNASVSTPKPARSQRNQNNLLT